MYGESEQNRYTSFTVSYVNGNIAFSMRVGLRGRRCPAKGSIYIGVGFGWPDDVNHPNHCELDNQGFFFIVCFDGHRA